MTAPSSLSLPVLRRLLNEATPGEWTAVCVQEWTQGWMVRDETGEPVTAGWFAADDAALIAVAVSSLPALLDLVERQAAAIEAVQELAAKWADPVSHADWCCMKGCVQPNGQHVKPGALDNLPFGVIPIPLPQVPCPGTCTCEVELFAAPLRTALSGITPTTEENP